MNDTPRRIEEDLAAIYLGNLNTVEDSLTLPATGKNGSVFSWESSEERFIDSTGRVNRPVFGAGDRTVVLTVTAALDGIRKERSFEANVLQEKKEMAIKELHPILKMTASPGTPELPHYITAVMTDGRKTAVPVRWIAMPEDWNEGETEEGERIFIGEAEGTQIPAFLYLKKIEKGERHAAESAIRYPAPGEVRLVPGSCFYDAAQKMGEWLLAADNDQMLYNFRSAAGLDTRGAAPMTGWDDPSGNLRGHTTGHYLSGLALAYSVTGDVRFKEKADDLVAGLAECQRAFSAGGRVKPGFLSAYDETQFDLLEEFTPYPQIWAPYYTLDKIMSGLYDAYVLAGNEEALQVESRMGDWAANRLSTLDPEKRRKMWSMYIAGEYGGMLGTMVRLYGLTKKEAHLLCASYFLNPKLLDPLEAGEDTLEDMHANQHIPQIIGTLEFYDVLGEGPFENDELKALAEDRERFFLAVMNFIEFVSGGHTYVNGGVGETEMFHRFGSAKTLFTDNTAESCATYNLERLYGEFFKHASSARIMDLYENSLINHILMSASHEADGGTTYFMPLRPGGRKEYSTLENTCCHGTGMESRFRYADHIFAFDDSSLYLNLYVPAALSGGISAVLSEDSEGSFRLQFRSDYRGDVRVRIPGWAGRKFSVSLRGEKVPARTEGGYALIPGGFSAGDEICIRMSYEVRRMSAGFGKVSLAYGPYILAALSDAAEYMKVPDLIDVRRNGDGSFEAGEIKMLPAYRVDREAYHMILNR